ncbi:MAG: type II toxin-antitoxin system Phd/YefM family antitoxin [Acidobacteria bacterium]|nr:type II toxin-antitoxin system Phd/YefM family antitoxin [Acidobacteriota bacterium]
MRVIKATEMRKHLGRCLDLAGREALIVERKGRPVVVVIALQEYERLRRIEDAEWTRRAAEADVEGYLGEKESAAILRGEA